MDYSADKLLSKKNIITFLLLAIIAAAIPVGVKLVQTQQLLRSQAVETGNEVTFPKLKQDAQGNYVTNTTQIEVKLQSPFGPPAPETQTQ
ncbi:MAG: hypothetical protein HY376_03620 [Candidatus Blackburnbacteria bacterium]|nr:hypothetical protein [Candidatus Blackburnbacteria bacterium]